MRKALGAVSRFWNAVTKGKADRTCFLLLGQTCSREVPVSLHATAHDAEEAALYLTQEAVIAAERTVFFEPWGKFIGARIVTFRDGVPIAAKDYGRLRTSKYGLAHFRAREGTEEAKIPMTLDIDGPEFQGGDEWNPVQ